MPEQSIDTKEIKRFVLPQIFRRGLHPPKPKTTPEANNPETFEAYIESLNPKEKELVLKIREGWENYLTKSGKHGSLYAVGGAVNGHDSTHYATHYEKEDLDFVGTIADELGLTPSLARAHHSFITDFVPLIRQITDASRVEMKIISYPKEDSEQPTLPIIHNGSVGITTEGARPMQVIHNSNPAAQINMPGNRAIPLVIV